MESFDVIIVGSGIAGLAAALELAPFKHIVILTKKQLHNASTYHAQGGIAAVLSSDDSLEAHIADTLTAGAGLCDLEATEAILSRGAQVIDWLIQQGVPLSQENNNKSLHLTQEGGHCARRIAHAADATGKRMHDTLVSRAKSHPNITIFEQIHAIDILTVSDPATQQAQACGLVVLNKRLNRIERFFGQAIILATGGASGIYRHTTHPDAPVGEGMAMAWRAGCSVANLEFTQFHPTSLYSPESSPFLISEALRGEGAILQQKTPEGGCGERFMLNYDRRAELAPRDIVARAIDQEMKTHHQEHVWLNISHQSAAFIEEHFPTIYSHCKALDIDITTSPIPVVPAAHYSCGGIMTDLTGKTDLAGLYAIGETAYTGLHGANRLASNSLLECLVFGFLAAENILQSEFPVLSFPVKYSIEETNEVDEQSMIQAENTLKRIMWDHVGIIRSNHSLRDAMEALTRLKTAMGWLTLPNSDSYRIELRNRVLIADLTIRSAMERKESRGLHYNIDYPYKRSNTGPTILKPD